SRRRTASTTAATGGYRSLTTWEPGARAATPGAGGSVPQPRAAILKQRVGVACFRGAMPRRRAAGPRPGSSRLPPERVDLGPVIVEVRRSGGPSIDLGQRVDTVRFHLDREVLAPVRRPDLDLRYDVDAFHRKQALHLGSRIALSTNRYDASRGIL